MNFITNHLSKLLQFHKSQKEDYSIFNHKILKDENIAWELSTLSSKELLHLIFLKYSKNYDYNLLSKEDVYNRVILFMFLVEWKYLLEFNKRLTNINWEYKNDMIYDKYENDFDLLFNKKFNSVKITNSVQACINFVFDKYEKYNFNYNKLFYLYSCTYPVMTSDLNGGFPNLNDLAIHYKERFQQKKINSLK